MEKVEAEKFMHKAIEVARIGLDNGEVIASAHTQEKSKGRLLVHAKLLALEAAIKANPFLVNVVTFNSLPKATSAYMLFDYDHTTHYYAVRSILLF